MIAGSVEEWTLGHESGLLQSCLALLFWCFFHCQDIKTLDIHDEKKAAIT
jgi:hypothetical protein